ncbi:MAG: DNA/RNA nuclease SfsA [Sulfolobaceae archaeon]|nr:DNA/RNA nuclease SfsA [Sulfolobaceae archaeon]
MRAGEVVYTFIEKLEEAIILERINRFTVRVKKGESELLCHLHDPGRLKELVYPGNKGLIREKKNGKFPCVLTASLGNNRWVITDSSIHNQIASKFLPENAKREVKVGNSRIDFSYDNTYVEVKGCTLVENGIAKFPDAPTKRGKRHLEELIKLMDEGKRAKLLILVMRDDAYCFTPNWSTDPEFSETFVKAVDEGIDVEVHAFRLEQNNIIYVKDLPLCEKYYIRGQY